MDPTFPVPNDGLKKRALADWDCSFDTEFTQPVSSIDYTTNTFTCDIPTFTRQGFFDFWLSITAAKDLLQIRLSSKSSIVKLFLYADCVF
jgi:hypothetical protein